MTKVFLATSDKHTAFAITEILSSHYNLEIFDNGIVSIKELQNKNYDLILIDTKLAGITGDELLEFVHSSKLIASQPVVMLIEGLSQEEKQHLVNLGVDDIIEKPLDIISTYKRLQNVMMISKLRKSVAESALKKEIDPMTGLLTYDAFQLKVRQLLTQGNFGSLLMCDLDNLGTINNNYSHQQGDIVIMTFAQCLREKMPKNSIIAHVSGDEFLVFIPNLTSKNEIGDYCNYAISEIGARIRLINASHQVTASIGISVCPDSARTFDNLLAKADHALLYVKNHSKGNFRFHSPIDDQENQLRGKMEYTLEFKEDILQSRKSDDAQLWLGFGEFRLIYISYDKFSKESTSPKSTNMLTIIDKKNTTEPNKEKILSLNEKITTFIKESHYPGIFSWYSYNQLIYFHPQEIPVPIAVTHLKNELANELKTLQLDITLS